MNFQDLLTKMKQIDEGTVEECGMAPMPPKQQDNVNMNVTMSGNGAGGIKDLINILKNIEQGEEPTGHDAVIIGNDEISDVERDLDDSYNNEPNPEVAGIDAVTPTGNDIHSKGDEAEKVNGGGNPWNQTEVDEALVNRLSAHYRRIKGDQETDEGSEIDRINAQGFDDPLPQGAYRTPQGQVQYAAPARVTPHPDDDATLNNMAAWATQTSRNLAMKNAAQGKFSKKPATGGTQVSGPGNDNW